MVTKTGAANQAAGLTALPTALDYLGSFPQFILYRLDPKPSGKLNKVPLSPETLQPASAHDPVNWMTAKVAFARSRLLNDHRYSVGFVLTANDDLFCLDVDGCADQSGWKPIVTEVTKALPGAAIEVSVSGNGLHVWGTYQGTAPAHKSKNPALNIELYMEKRFIALGRPDCKGNASTDCTAGLSNAIARWFEPGGNGAVAANVWTTEPCPDWNGYPDDDELIECALRAKSASATFNDNKAAFVDLWECDDEALTRAWPVTDRGDGLPFDASSADAALAQHLAFWTGKDCERMQRLMQQSKLQREKWERPDYLRRTILHAVSVCASVYTRQASVGPPSEAGNGSGANPSGSLLRCGETDIANILAYERRGLNCFSLDGRSWFERDHGELWQPDKGSFGVRNLIRKKMDQTLSLKRGSGVRGIKYLMESALGNLEPWDADPKLCGLPDHRVLNLATGQVQPAEATDWISRRLGAIPVAGTATRWEKFLEEIVPVNDSAAYISWLQVWFGYVLTGYIRERNFIFLSGSGGNGKSVLLDTLAEIMGDYAVTLPSDALLGERKQHAQWETALDGPRLASVPEVSPGVKWKIVDLKELTGGGRIAANRMHQNTYDFLPTAKIIIVGNDRPDLVTVDNAIRDRIILLELDRRPARPDKKLIEKLREEHGQILAWMVEGAQKYLRYGLPQIPASAQTATVDYLSSEDQFAQFIEDCFVETPGGRVSNAEIWNALATWRINKGVFSHWGVTRITKELKKRNYQTYNTKGVRGFLGFSRKPLGPVGIGQ